MTQSDKVLERARGGSGGVLYVEGLAGLGKTTLVDALRERARSAGMRVLHARGGELEREMPLELARGVFADAALNADADLSDAARRGLALLHGGGEATDASGAAHALDWLAADLAADRPTVIAVDDAHWADAASLRWLADLAGRMESDELAVVVAAARATTPARRGRGCCERSPRA